MRRRDFIKVLAGSAITWPLGAHAQQLEQVRRIGVLMNLAANDPEGQARIAAFRQGLQMLGWEEGQNTHIDYRWTGGALDRMRGYAAELLSLKPNVILATNSPTLEAVRNETSTTPIVFVQIVDPVTSGYVVSLANPGGNITGFTNFERPIIGKWIELLKGNRSWGETGRRYVQSRQCVMARKLSRHKGYSVAASDGADLSRCPKRRRYRTSSRCARTRAERLSACATG